MKDKMKKMYKTPQVEIAYVDYQAMVATSDPTLDVFKDPTNNPGCVNENGGCTDIWGNGF